MYDEETNQPLAADFKLTDLGTGKVFKHAIANSGSGEFMVAIPKNKDFALHAEHEGYFFYSENYSLDKIEKIDSGFLINVPMSRIKANTFVVLKNIFFDVNKWELKNESITELNKVFELLIKNPSIKIELGGHTDSDSDDHENQILSENRAKSVFEWLVNKGIPNERMTYKGYGESRPLVPNTSSKNKAKNRRTELTIQ